MKRILALALVLVFTLTLLPPASAADIAEGDGWRLDGDGCLHITGYISYMYNTPWYNYRTQITGVLTEEGSSADNCRKMFMGCGNLKSADLSSLDTSSVTDMCSMFYNCSSLTSLDISGFDTSSATDISLMFYGCSSLDSIDVSGFDTSNVTDMSYMFYGCSSPDFLDVSGFDTSNVTDMCAMFYNCSSLTAIDVTGFDTSGVTDMSWMFYGCSSLESLDVTGFDTSKVTDMNSMFYNCSSLTALDLSGFAASAVRDMSYMFYGCRALERLGVTPGILNKTAADLIAISPTWYNAQTGEAYAGADALRAIGENVTIVVSADDIETGEPEIVKIASGDGWYLDGDGCLHITGYISYYDMNVPWKDYRAQIKSVAAEDGASADNCRAMFYSCENLISADLSRLDTSRVTNMESMFMNCKNLPSLDLSGLDTSAVTNMREIFGSCLSLISIDLSGLDTSACTNMSGMFDTCQSLASLDVTGFDTSSVTDMRQMFQGCSSLTSLDVTGFETSRVTNMRQMFSLCPSLASLDLRGFDTSAVTDMASMFISSSSLATLGITPDMLGVNARDIAAISPTWYDARTGEAYAGADALAAIRETVTLVVSADDAVIASGDGWVLRGDGHLNITGDVSYDYVYAPWFDYGAQIVSVTAEAGSRADNCAFMFSFCENLVSADLSELDTSAVTDMSWMFAHCSSLESLDLGGVDTSAVTDMSDMFYGCSSLESLDLSGFDTSCVTSMKWMFSDCSSLESLDLSGLDTSRVTNMNSMFCDCSSLKTLDVSGFDTSAVTDMFWMFYGCSSLESLDVSGFDTSAVTTMRSMFNGCSELAALDVSGFNTSAVTDMGWMFAFCSSLEAVDVSGFDASNAADTGYMFGECESLAVLAVSPEILGENAHDLLAVSPTWYNAQTGAEYADAEALRAIGETVTLVWSPAENSASLSLEGNVGVNFYLDLDAYLVADRVEITCADPNSETGRTVTYVFDSFDGLVKDGLYKFTVETAAAQMTEPIEVRVFAGGNVLIYEADSTVRELLETYIEYYADYPVITDLCESMLSYGANAQRYFDYNVSALADENYGADTSAVTAFLVEGFDTLWADADESDNFAYAAQTFSCRASTEMRYAFSVDAGYTAQDFSAEFTEGGEGLALEITDKGSQVVVSVTGIPAAYLDNYFTFTVKCGEKDMGAVSSCGLCYAKLVLNSDKADGTLGDLVKSIYIYNAAANRYFGK